MAVGFARPVVEFFVLQSDVSAQVAGFADVEQAERARAEFHVGDKDRVDAFKGGDSESREKARLRKAKVAIVDARGDGGGRRKMCAQTAVHESITFAVVVLHSACSIRCVA